MVEADTMVSSDPGDASSSVEGFSETGFDEESVLQALLNPPHSRMVGGTEYSWCRAVSSGTGITILALLFSHPLDDSTLQQIIDKVQSNHPRLRSQLVWIQGRPALSVSPVPIVKLQILDAPEASRGGSLVSENVVDVSYEVIEDSNSSVELVEGKGLEEEMANLKCEEETGKDRFDQDQSFAQGKEEGDWLRIVEIELNTNDWPEQHHCLDPKPMFVVRLYKLPQGRSLLVLRLHTAVCDRASASTILTEMLHSFYESQHGSSLLPKNGFQSEGELAGESVLQNGKQEAMNNGASAFVAVEDTIPKGKANKPFWAHGVDILGYSLGSRRHAVLPFHDTDQPRRSEIVCHTLSVEHTQQLLQMCSMHRTTRLGALCAAGMKATAILKQLGNRSEHYAVITLVDCRNLLDPVLSDSAVGFYHSAILNTHNLNEVVDFWDLARRCSSSLENALKNRKHFTDMGDVNFLMCQAIQFPQLTPASSLRTSLLVLFEEPVFDDLEDLKKAVGLEDYVGCSSIHGVGPSLAIFDTIQHGALKSTCVYPAPLHSRSQISTLLNSMMGIIIDALNS